MTTKIAKRERWQSRLGIIFATSGSAIGLGTIWKLPYMVGQNGGGAFIALFLTFTFLLGTPLFIAELALGKISQKSVLKSFATMSSKTTLMPLFGFVAIIATLLIAGWYAVVSGFSLHYLTLSFTDAFKNKEIPELLKIFKNFRANGFLNVFWQAIFIAITCIILAKGIKTGIERASKLLFALLFALVLILFAYSTTLSGFDRAINYIIYPDFNEVTSESIMAALGLSLFALSLGQGIMLTYGSYLKPKDDIFKTAFIVSSSVIAISILISLMIFPMVFTFSLPPDSGESLLFATMPYVTERLPGSTVILVAFFIALFFAALTSYIGQVEVLIASLMDSFGQKRPTASLIAGIGCFIVGLPCALMNSDYNPFPYFENVFHKSFLDTSYILIDWLLIIFSLGVCLSIYYMPKAVLAKALNSAEDHPLFFMWHALIRFVVPICLLLVAINRIGF